MTEERFTKSSSSYHNCNICEIFIDGRFFCVSPIDYADKILDLLEENEQLKKDVDYWRQVASQYSNELNVFEHCKDSD